MKQKKDTRFWLTTFLEEQEQDNPIYKWCQNEIKNNSHAIIKVDGVTAKIYNAQLFTTLSSKELQVRDMDSQKEAIINGCEYLETYIKAYKEGEQFFENEFKISPDTLYGAKAEQYVRAIHSNYYHIEYTKYTEGIGTLKGWGNIKNRRSYVLTHEIIRKHGYYSGIVNKVEEQIKTHPQLFATFNKCDHELAILSSQQTNTDTIRHPAKHYVLAYLIECNAKGEGFPFGKKKKLEQIGNQKMGVGKGNRFYKVFNEIASKDLNTENNLIEIGGDNWRTIIKDLSDEPETIEVYLQSKQL